MNPRFLFSGSVLLVGSLLLMTQAQAARKMGTDQIAKHVSKSLEAFDIQVSEEELLQLPVDPRIRNDHLAETLSNDIPEGPEGDLAREMRDGYLARTFDVLDPDTQKVIYQLAFEKSLLQSGVQSASEMLVKASQGYHEQDRRIICSVTLKIMKERGQIPENKLKELSTLPSSDSIRPRNLQWDLRNLVPLIASKPGMSRENCSYGEKNEFSIQIRDLVRIASPRLAAELLQLEQSTGSQKSVESTYQAGCPVEIIRFLIQKPMYMLQSVSAGASAGVDETYNGCQIKGTLQKKTATSYVFIAGNDFENSSRTPYFRNAEEGGRMIMAMGKIISSKAEKRPDSHSPVLSPAPSVSIANPFGAAK